MARKSYRPAVLAEREQSPGIVALYAFGGTRPWPALHPVAKARDRQGHMQHTSHQRVGIRRVFGAAVGPVKRGPRCLNADTRQGGAQRVYQIELQMTACVAPREPALYCIGRHARFSDI